MCGDADRQESFPDRGDLAGSLHRLVLSAGAREDPRPGRPRRGSLGHQGQGAQRPRARAAGREGTRLLRVLPHGRRSARGVPPTAKLSLRERARATMEAGYRAFRMGAGDVPIGDVYDTRSIVRRIEQECREVARGSRTRRELVHRLPPALRPRRRRALLQGHRAPRAALRRGSRARRACAGGHPQAAADDDGSPDARRRVGPALGLQPPGREPRRRLHPLDPAQRRRDHRDDEGGRPLRDARGRHRPALHGPHRHRRPRQLPVHVLRARDAGVQLRRPAHRLPAGMPGLQERQGVHQPAAGPRRHSPT